MSNVSPLSQPDQAIPIAVLFMFTELLQELDASFPESGERMRNRLENLMKSELMSQSYPEAMKLVKAAILDMETARRGRI